MGHFVNDFYAEKGKKKKKDKDNGEVAEVTEVTERSEIPPDRMLLWIKKHVPSLEKR